MIRVGERFRATDHAPPDVIEASRAARVVCRERERW
jgi:hypothetical protein